MAEHMTPRELADWGPVRCFSAGPRTVIHEGIVTATTIDSVLVRDHNGASRWFKASLVEAVGAAPGGAE